MNNHRMCECCRTNFLLKDMKGDLCIVCYDFIQTRIESKLAEYEAIKKKYKTIFLDRFVDAKVEDARIWKEKYDQLKQQLAEKEKEKIEFATKHLKEANRKIDELVGYSDYNVWEKFDQQIKELKGE